MHARLILGKIYAEQGKTELSQSMYDYIMERISSESFDERSRVLHIYKHMKDNKEKNQHGVFIKDPLKLLEDVEKQMNEENKKNGYMCDIYLIEAEECGYAGGKTGDGHKLNYITVITLPNSKTLIAMFPSDNVFEMEQDNKIERNVPNNSDDGR